MQLDTLHYIEFTRNNMNCFPNYKPYYYLLTKFWDPSPAITFPRFSTGKRNVNFHYHYVLEPTLYNIHFALAEFRNRQEPEITTKRWYFV